jgi:hypothetical protein
MNEPILSVPSLETTAAPDYKDRSTGLVVFGILTLGYNVRTQEEVAENPTMPLDADGFI